MFVVDMHDKLGHSSIGNLEYIRGIVIKSTPAIDCKACPLAKQSRLAFPISNTIAQNPFELIHVDIWGPYKEIQ